MTKFVNSNLGWESSFPVCVASRPSTWPWKQTAEAAVEPKQEVITLNLNSSLQACLCLSHNGYFSAVKQMESWLESSNLPTRLFTILKVSPLWGLATTTDKWGNFLGLRSTSATDRHISATEWQWVRLASLKLRRVWSLEFEYGESMELSWIEFADSSDKMECNIFETDLYGGGSSIDRQIPQRSDNSAGNLSRVLLINVWREWGSHGDHEENRTESRQTCSRFT